MPEYARVQLQSETVKCAVPEEAKCQANSGVRLQLNRQQRRSGVCGALQREVRAVPASAASAPAAHAKTP